MRVLSIDPALRNTGYAVVERIEPASGKAPRAAVNTATRADVRTLTYGVIRNPSKMRQTGCLVAIRERIVDVIREHRPEVCAVEGVIYVQSYRTAITLGAARGAAILAAAEHGLEVYEYAPRRVKQAVVGRGAADKQQVAFMMRALLGLTETPPPDAADALAIGLAHLYATDPARALKETPEAI
ncbi:MAG: crossover junction endodeoxyribonuclease RuvC [Verrucomicrobiae bacterium]|nr:crossover junction endodeoxyribonuclease RuvC [Verrucomicrobiae bacterium]MCP5541735.1 crossover junction endodeoxyribonuclease RuvC [Akkermansiaceae bacterium]MCP5551738.1 crossover junction endodeoxyribonuclease RuvC [Akkermansiaceae bacterium]